MKMINKKVFFVILFLTILVAGGVYLNNSRHPFSVRLIRIDQGWGYDIMLKGKLIIHQPYMPGASGQTAFVQKSSARKIGLLVVKKLENKKSPSVSMDELNIVL